MKKTILITGTTNGIGKELELKLTNDYELVTINKIGSQKNHSSEFTKNYNLDITDKEAVQNLLSNLKKENIEPDIFLLNAGINIYDNENHFVIQKFKKCFDINFYGAMNFVSAINLLKYKNKKIIFFSSTSNIVANPAALGYFSSKLLLKKLTGLLNINRENNLYKSAILGPIKTLISRDLKKPEGLAGTIYKILAVEPQRMIPSFVRFIENKKIFFYYTKTSVLFYFFISVILKLFPRLYKGGKK